MNLVNYFKRLGASASTSAIGVSVSGGCSYLATLVGGWIADAHLGRYRTICASVIVYLCGLVLLTMSAVIPGIRVDDGTQANAWQWMLLIICLFLVAAGTGGIKPNVSAFGADQFDDSRERDREEKKSFFNWFYVFINIGGLLAATVVVYVQDQGLWGVSFAGASETSSSDAPARQRGRCDRWSDAALCSDVRLGEIAVSLHSGIGIAGDEILRHSVQSTARSAEALLVFCCGRIGRRREEIQESPPTATNTLAGLGYRVWYSDHEH